MASSSAAAPAFAKLEPETVQLHLLKVLDTYGPISDTREFKSPDGQQPTGPDDQNVIKAALDSLQSKEVSC